MPDPECGRLERQCPSAFRMHFVRLVSKAYPMTGDRFLIVGSDETLSTLSKTRQSHAGLGSRAETANRPNFHSRLSD